MTATFALARRRHVAARRRVEGGVTQAETDGTQFPSRGRRRLTMCYRGWPKLVILAAWLGAWGFLVAASCCGNGVVESGEQCDDGANNGTNRACLPTCNWNACGDGNLCSDTTTCGKEGPTAVEQCDDGPKNGTSEACLST